MGVRTARLAALSAVALIGSVLVVAGPAEATGKHSSSLKPVVTNLVSPRGVATFGGKIIYSVGDGSVYEAWANGKRIRKLGQVPGGFAPAIDTNKWGTTYALTGAGGEPGQPLPPGGATLYRLRPGKSPVKVADIGKYQLTDPDPYNLADSPTESNPFGVAALKDGTVLVSDAANNDLLRVWPNGHIKTVARLKPRTVKVPTGLPPGSPPAGSSIPSEAVATSVTVGSDGYWYVGELRGFPATPGTSQIWRIKPGSHGAVCDPAKPYKGKCQRYADGYTSIVDLAGGPRGTLAVVELAKISWLKFELGGGNPVLGSLFLQYPGKHHKAGFKKELAKNKLLLPGGTAISRSGDIYVSSPLFGPGAIYKVKH
ncbi:ScyD/ScyE family protein [Kribbella qitaiheensis]|uniref:ScyD/ScyE family protein n=1 Tax=Kribbella qitaiheensis TaxID=1544730 RepID=UPI00360E7EE8